MDARNANFQVCGVGNSGNTLLLVSVYCDRQFSKMQRVQQVELLCCNFHLQQIQIRVF